MQAEYNDHPHLFLSQNNPNNSCPNPYAILEVGATFADVHVATNFGLPDYEHVHGSVDGLVLLCGRQPISRILLCNPITREYLRIPNPPRHYAEGNIGFGASRSGQYKLVWISLDNNVCHVYTLGTGQWRRAARGPSRALRYEKDTVCASLNGHIYWAVKGKVGWKMLISCFDLETEEFTYFRAPPDIYSPQYYGRNLSVLEDRLCFYDYSIVLGTVIWTMKGQGCWIKEFVIKGMLHDCRGSVFPIKVFRDGNTLLADR